MIENHEHVKLKRLVLSENTISSSGMATLGEFLRLNTTMESLVVNWTNTMDGKGFFHLIRNALLNPRSCLEHLEMYRSGVYDLNKDLLDDIDGLFEDKTVTNSRIKAIQFGHSKFVGDGRGLGLIVSKLLALETLGLKSSNVDDTFISGLAKGIEKLSKLRIVDLSDNDITHLGAQTIRNCQDKSQSLFTVNYQQNDIGDEGFRYLIPGRVVSLDFENIGLTSLSEPHLRKIVDHLPQSGGNIVASLESNDLMNKNNDLSTLFTNKRITRVYLSGNRKLGNIGLRKLIPVLEQQHTIEDVYIRDTGFTEEIGRDFWEVLLGNGYVKGISVGDNAWTLRGLKDFVEAVCGLESGRQLNSLNFYSTKFDQEMFDALLDFMTMKCRTTFREINLGYCQLSEEMIISLSERVDEIKSKSIRMCGNVVSVQVVKLLAHALLKRTTRLFVDIACSAIKDIDEELITLLASKEGFLNWFSFPYYFEKKIEALVEERLKNSENFFNNLSLIGTTTLNLANKGLNKSNIGRIVEKLLGFEEEIPRLVSIDISSNDIEDEGMEEHFSKLLKRCSDLESLDISSCGLNDGGVSCALSSLENCKNVKNLKFSGNKIGEESMKILAESNFAGEKKEKKEEPMIHSDEHTGSVAEEEFDEVEENMDAEDIWGQLSQLEGEGCGEIIEE